MFIQLNKKKLLSIDFKYNFHQYVYLINHIP